MRIPLTQYGRRELLLATVVFGALTATGAWLFWPAALLPAAAWALVVMFFRDPPRQAEGDGFLAPADGKVVDVTPVGADGRLRTEGTRIGIFMSLLDCHVNRSPCAAAVAAIEHHDGGYLDARRPEASQANESATILLTHTRGGRQFQVVVRQIAGLVARRIVTDLRVGQQLAAGQRIGMIKFGSRVEVLLPAGLIGRIGVQVGQTVRAGRTVLVHPPGQEAPS
jgi:phosphatidylserine decarboxylase